MIDKDSEAKQAFINALVTGKGIISYACSAVKISRWKFYKWREEDPEFEKMCTEVMEIQGDIVENKLLDLIESGDTTAIIFYCKTKLKHRGYSEKPIVIEKKAKGPEVIETTATEVRPDPALKKRVKAKKTYIVKLLKEQGKYSPEMAMQVDIAAQLFVKAETIAAEIFSSGHSPVSIEYSREGNERQIVSQKEKLYMDYLQQAQRALRALGMNTDSRDRKMAEDGFSDFLSAFKE